MKKITSITLLLLLASYLAAQTTALTDTTFRYNKRNVVVNEKNGEINVSVYRQNGRGDTIKSEKIYEGIFTDDKTVERTYKNNFVISVPDIFMPRKNRRVNSNVHWGGFGIGFSNISGELAPALNVNRSLQYNLNFCEGFRHLGNSGLKVITGMGIQFNSIHFESNKAIEVKDYKSVIAMAEGEKEYTTSRLHYTYLTFPLLFQKDIPTGIKSHFFINGGVVAKIKTASSSKVWYNENGKEKKMQMAGELNIRPITFDFLVQAGYKDFGFFASYSPLSLFLDKKGPKGNQTTLGAQYYF